MLEIMRASARRTKTQSSFLYSDIIIQLFPPDWADHLEIQQNLLNNYQDYFLLRLLV